jgi:hypothetical protein
VSSPPPEAGVTLRDYLERLLAEHALQHAEHQAAHDREHRQAAVTARADSDKLNVRLESMNAFREELTRLSATFPPSAVVDQRFVALQERIDTTAESLERRYEADLKAQAARIASLELARANLEGRIVAVAGVAGLAGIGVSVLLHFL